MNTKRDRSDSLANAHDWDGDAEVCASAHDSACEDQYVQVLASERAQQHVKRHADTQCVNRQPF